MAEKSQATYTMQLILDIQVKKQNSYDIYIYNSLRKLYILLIPYTVLYTATLNLHISEK